MSTKAPLMSTDDDPRVEHVAGPELTARELYEILRLRVDVFVVEQECPYPELDGRDLEAETRHVWVEDATGVASYVRVLADQPNGSDARRIGRVVTRPDRRGEQLAGQLLSAILNRLGPVDTRLEAQSHLTSYYGTFGYEPSGAEYIEDGIPHTPMARLAGASDITNEAAT